MLIRAFPKGCKFNKQIVFKMFVINVRRNICFLFFLSLSFCFFSLARKSFMSDLNNYGKLWLAPM